MQVLAWYATIVLVLAVLTVFLFVLARSGARADYDPVRQRAGHIRTMVFWLLILVCIPATVVSLGDVPYVRARATAQPTDVIQVTARQWSWTLSQNEVTARQPVEFQVTSADVNHGFAIYDENLSLLAQTQAMPNYVNRLRYTFTKPGTYRVLCLEYCGLAHHTMWAEIKVRSQ